MDWEQIVQFNSCSALFSSSNTPVWWLLWSAEMVVNMNMAKSWLPVALYFHYFYYYYYDDDVFFAFTLFFSQSRFFDSSSPGHNVQATSNTCN